MRRLLGLEKYKTFKCSENIMNRFQRYSTSDPPLRPFAPGGGWRSRGAHHRPPQPPHAPLRTGANHRNVSRCQEAVKCWRGGQRAFTHMWLYFHNSILLFLLISFICSSLFSFLIFFFHDSPPPLFIFFINLFSTWRYTCVGVPGGLVSAPTGCVMYCRASSQDEAN